MSKENYPRIDVSVDAVVFGHTPGEDLSVLLIKRKNEPFKGCWALPGGFVEVDENVETAALRELKEETGIELNYMEQLYTFSDPKRDPRKRVISIAHFAIVKKKEHTPKAADDAEELEWFPLNFLPQLAFDHSEIIALARTRMKAIINDEKPHLLKFFSEKENREISAAL